MDTSQTERERAVVPAETFATTLAAKLTPAAIAPLLAQRALEAATDLGASDVEIFAMFFHAAIKVARASDNPLDFGDAMHAGGDLLWKEARGGH